MVLLRSLANGATKSLVSREVAAVIVDATPVSVQASVVIEASLLVEPAGSVE